MTLRLGDKPEIGAYAIDFRSMIRRVRAIERFASKDEPILFVGDDDLASLAIHFLGYRNLTLLDFDSDLLSVVARASRGRIRVVEHDLRSVYRGRLPRLARDHVLFVTDPPYGADGLRVFSGVGLGALRVGGHGLVVCPSERAPGSSVGQPLELTALLQRFVLQSGGVFVGVDERAARSYHGTVSHSWVVRKLTRAKAPFDSLLGPHAFY